MSSANIAVCVARGKLKSARAVKGLVRALSAVPDFRIERRKRHRLHWVLDVVFGEDYCRARSGFAPENLNALRKLAQTLLLRNGIPGKGVKDMRLECAWDFDQAVKVLFGGEAEEVR